MLKFHPITAFIKTYTNFKKYFWLGFLVEICLSNLIKISILDLMFLPKNSVPFEELYYSSTLSETDH